MVTYAEIKNIYQEYGENLTELEFAEVILGLSYTNYMKCKSDKDRKAKILKEMETENKRAESDKSHKSMLNKISNSKKQEIIDEIAKKGYVSKLISYDELKQLYKKYGNGMSEIFFAQEILGISYSNYMNCKNKGSKTKVRNKQMDEKAKEIKLLYINHSGYYSKEFIDKICMEYDITIEDFLSNVFVGGLYDCTPYLNALQKKGKLYIGRAKLSEKFLKANIELIQRIADKASYIVSKKYSTKSKKDDYEQEIVIYIMERMGFLENNLGDDLESFEKICMGMSVRYCKLIMFSEKNVSKRYVGLREFKKRRNEIEGAEDELPDLKTHIEDEVLNKLSENIEDNSDKCVSLLKKYIELGYTRDNAIQMTAKEMGINKEKMLEYMQQHLLTHGKVKVTKDGQVEMNQQEIEER